MKPVHALAALLLTISHCCGSSFVINWSYQYGVDSPGTKNESVYGKLLYQGKELPKEYGHVITPIGEFLFINWRGSGSNEEIRWVPYGRLAGYAGGNLNAANTESQAQQLLTGNDATFRRVLIANPPSVASPLPCIPGSFDKHPKGVGKDWFFAVTQGLWVNPTHIDDVMKTKLAAQK